MREITKVERRVVPAAAPPPLGELEDAISWLSQHVGFPARSKAELERKRKRSR